jgi:hypothetical protein
MVIAARRFNIYLQILLFSLLLTSCKSLEKKQLAVLEIHLETKDIPEHVEQVIISRDRPFSLNVLKQPFLIQNDIAQAQVIDVVGGFALRLQFDHQGAWLLEETSGGNPGKHLAIFSQFIVPPENKLNTGRWLAGPRMNKRITDGVLVFTPDTTREEAENIALGLNNVAKSLGKAPKSDK